MYVVGVLQGVLSPDDARVALQYGVDGIIVSNHGGCVLLCGLGLLRGSCLTSLAMVYE